MNRRIQTWCGRIMTGAVVVAVVGFGGSVWGWSLSPAPVLVAYLGAYDFWVGLSVGCLLVAMIHHLTGGHWGFAVRRILEAGFMTLPVMAVFFLPIVLNASRLYPWTAPGRLTDPLMHFRNAYLTSPGFASRAVLALGTWCLLGFLLRRWSLRQDTTADPAPTLRMRFVSGPGIVIVGLTATFAFVDWIMSCEPEWRSTIFPVVQLAGDVLAAFALSTLCLAGLRLEPPYAAVVESRHFHDLGNLLLAFVMFWTYVAFSQLLVIYSGNLPKEIEWYLHRTEGGWRYWVTTVALFHFALPFFLLLFRSVKRRTTWLAVLSAMLLVVHGMDAIWQVAPTYRRHGPYLHWLDVCAFAVIGGAWVATAAFVFRRAPLLPVNDPRIQYATQDAHAHAR